MLGALGVVFGDIGTSPLYALRECFNAGHHALALEPGNILGVLSVIFWVLILVISLEYVTFILRADNNGEGGILALMSLVVDKTRGHGRWRRYLVFLGLVGAALLFADAMITPAISVLSALEGLKVQTPFLKPYVLPTAVEVLEPVPHARGVAATERIITLTSCHPMLSAAERIIAYGVFEEWQPASAGPPEELANLDMGSA